MDRTRLRASLCSVTITQVSFSKDQQPRNFSTSIQISNSLDPKKFYNVGISKDNKGGIQLLGERALTEFGSNFEPRRSSVVSEASMNTQ